MEGEFKVRMLMKLANSGLKPLDLLLCFLLVIDPENVRRHLLDVRKGLDSLLK